MNKNAFHVESMSHDLFSTKFAKDGCCDTLAQTDYKEPPIVAYIADKHKRNIVINSSGNGITAPIDASYYKWQGLRQGIEREYVVIVDE